MPSYYEINVALNGKHLFATAPRSITSGIKFNQIISLFKKKFPKEEGYEVTGTYWECVGKGINVD